MHTTSTEREDTDIPGTLPDELFVSVVPVVGRNSRDQTPKSIYAAPDIIPDSDMDEDTDADGSVLKSNTGQSPIHTTHSKQEKSRLSGLMWDEVQMDDEKIHERGSLMSLYDGKKQDDRKSFFKSISERSSSVKRSKSSGRMVSQWAGQATTESVHVYLGEDHHSSSACILKPNSAFCRVWHIMTAVVVIYIVSVVSFDIGFSWWKISKPMSILNYTVDAYCWMDMLVTLRTGYVHGGHVVMDWKKIAKHYLEFWFWIDFFACVPWEAIISVSKSNRKTVKFVKWLKLPRLLRLGRLRKIMKAHARYMNLFFVLTSIGLCVHLGACSWVYLVDPCASMVELSPFADWSYVNDVDDDMVTRHPQLGWECTQGNIVNIYLQAAHTSLGMLLGVDRGNFGGYISGGGESSNLRKEVDEYSRQLESAIPTWQHDSSATSVLSLKHMLLRRRYPLSIAENMAPTNGGTQSTSGELCIRSQTINVERDTNVFGLGHGLWMNVFCSFMLVLGCYLQGMLFANITKLVYFGNAAETSFRQSFDEATRELDFYGHLVPELVQKRISKHFEFRWLHQAYGPLQLLCPDLLSRSLRAEIALYLYKDSVTNVEFLKLAPIDVLQAVCMNLERQYYMQQDAIYRRGEFPQGLFIVDLGRVWLSQEDTFEEVSCNDDVVEVSSGSSFGVGSSVAAIQGRIKAVNRKNAFAATVCHTLCLPLGIFKSICDEQPWFFKDLLQLETANRELETETVDLASFTACHTGDGCFRAKAKMSIFSTSTEFYGGRHDAVADEMPALSVSRHGSILSGSLSGSSSPGKTQAGMPLLAGDTAGSSALRGLSDRVAIVATQLDKDTEKLDAANSILKNLLSLAATRNCMPPSLDRSEDGLSSEGGYAADDIPLLY